MNYISRCVYCKRVLTPTEILFNGNTCNACTVRSVQTTLPYFDEFIFMQKTKIKK